MRGFVDNVEKNGVEQLKSEGMEVVTNVDRKKLRRGRRPGVPRVREKVRQKSLLDGIKNTQ